MPSSLEPTPPNHTTDASPAAYRSVSPAAVGALALGLLSPLAFVGPMLWFMPAAGLFAAASALRATSQPGALLMGGSIARAGLLLSLCFGVAAPVEMYGARWFLTHSAEPFAMAFFNEFAEGQPQNALQFRKTSAHRRALGESLWDFYRRDEKAQRELKNFVAEPIVKTLLLLGHRADVRLYESGAVERLDNRQTLPQIYAVTFDSNGRKTTLFIALILERSEDAGQTPTWRVASIGGPVRPSPWER